MRKPKKNNHVSRYAGRAKTLQRGAKKKCMLSPMDDEQREFRALNRRRESLAEFVRRVRAEKRLSTYEVEKESGYRISSTSVWRIENGYTQNVSEEKLLALAKGLGVVEEEILQFASGKDRDETRHELPARINGFYQDSPPIAQVFMDALCETVWRVAKHLAERGELLELQEPTNDDGAEPDDSAPPNIN